MQIDRYNHLLFPRDNAPTATGKEPASGAGASGVAQPQARVPAAVASEVGAARAESVVLKIQWPDDPATARNDADAGVYAPARKAVPRDDADTDTQALDHQRALDRNTGVFTRLTVNKDGVLVAKPQAEARQPDFVALAVSAMREFSDEAERQKTQAPAAAAEAPAGGMAWGRLKDLQQLAAKFNVFA